MTLLSPALIPAAESAYLMQLGKFASGLSHVHGVWKWYRYGELFNKDNALGLGVGHLVDFILPDSTILKLPAVPFYVGAQLLRLFSTEDAVVGAWGDLKQAVFCTIPVNPKTKWITKSSLNYVVSRYTLTWWINDFKTIAIRTHAIAICTLQLVLESFKLVMRIMDVIEIFTLDPDKIKAIAKQSIRQAGVDVPLCLNALVKNQNVFLERLGNKTVFGYGVEAIGGDPEKVKEAVQTLFNKMETGLDIYQKVSETFGDGVICFVKKGFFDIGSTAVGDEKMRALYDPDSDESNCFRTIKPESKSVGLISFENVRKRKSKEEKVEPIKVTPPPVTPKTPLVVTPKRSSVYDLSKRKDKEKFFQSPKKRSLVEIRKSVVPVVNDNIRPVVTVA
jgi:hypothetical protein